MYRTGELTKPNYPSSSSSGANEKLKQKKRLSFREPEVETPHNSSWSNSNRIQSKQPALPAPIVDKPRRSTSLEDLTLEDQTFIIAKHVGQAFDKRSREKKQLSPTTALKTSSSETRSIRRNSCFLSETLKNDCSRLENGLQKYGSNTRAAITSEDAQFFEALSPPVMNISTMKFPAIEVSESGSSIGKSNHALVASSEVVSTSVQHQMQFLKYQLEQQRQQTQAALAHIQLLKDQLQAESSARYKTQTQNHQLIMQNKELLDHIQNLFQQIEGLEKLMLEKQERKSTFLPSSSSSTSQETQITESNIRNAFTAQKNNENHPAKASGFAEATMTNAITTPKNSNGGHPAKTSASAEANKTNAITAQINSNVNSPAKVSTFAPNTIMANRRSSLTSIKPFQSKGNYLEPNSRLSSRDTSPVPTSPVSKNPPFPDAEETSISNTNGGRSFLFKSTQRYYENKESSPKERNDERRNVTKTTDKPQVSPITLTDFTLKNTATSNPKSVTNNELHTQDENLVLNDNPFLIEEKRPGKLEGYASRKNNSSEGSSTKISSVALSPKSYSTWSKSSKFHKNDCVAPLAYENTSDLCIKETQRFSLGNSRLFNS